MRQKTEEYKTKAPGKVMAHSVKTSGAVPIRIPVGKREKIALAASEACKQEEETTGCQNLSWHLRLLVKVPTSSD
ncbi:hypothetical protein BaRGS_00018693 [Batillaria attramentaria]|uniref:Uncharacterized protein n=1 Tax=Batillaria attramentaria TaxID=370345 RepID=A0ABD0KSX2_9CAEN